MRITTALSIEYGIKNRNNLCGPARNVTDNSKAAINLIPAEISILRRYLRNILPPFFQLFYQIHNEVISFGKMNVYPVKNGVMYSVNSTFLALKPHKNYLAVEFVSNQKRDEFPVEKCVRIAKSKYANILQIDSPSAIDNQLVRWLHEAYIINLSQNKTINFG